MVFAVQFKVIVKLVEALGKDGERIKAEVDDAIDRCPHLQNLREVIIYTHDMFHKETQERRAFWQRMSINFFERYSSCLSVCVYVYVYVYVCVCVCMYVCMCMYVCVWGAVFVVCWCCC